MDFHLFNQVVLEITTTNTKKIISTVKRAPRRPAQFSCSEIEGIGDLGSKSSEENREKWS